MLLKFVWDWMSGILGSHFGSTVAIPWPAVIQVKSFPFSFLGRKDIADSTFLARAPKMNYVKSTALQVCWVRKNQINNANPHPPRQSCTRLNAGMRSTFVTVQMKDTWWQGHPYNHFLPRHCWNAAPQLCICIGFPSQPYVWRTSTCCSFLPPLCAAEA